MTNSRSISLPLADSLVRVREDGTSVPDTRARAAADLATCTPLEEAATLESMAHAATLPLEETVESGSPYCQRCEVLPRTLTGPGTLHLNLPHTHSLGKVLSWLVQEGRDHTHRDGTVSVRLTGDGLASAMGSLADLLTTPEYRDSRAVFQHEGEALHPSDYFKITPLAAFEARRAAGWLLDLLRERRIVSFFQPIVSLQGGDGVHGYECLMRGEREGGHFAPGPMIEEARRADLIFQLDAAGRRAAILGASRHRLSHKVFINFTPNAIYEPRHCLDSTVRLVDECGLDRAQVVFEVTEAERLPEMRHLRRIVDYYREKGFAVALDDIGSGYSSLNVLLGLEPDYVKLDMELVRDVHRNPAKAVVTRKLLEAVGELGLKTIAEGIETREEFEWVREHGAAYGQGYYFAHPAAAPPALATASAGVFA